MTQGLSVPARSAAPILLATSFDEQDWRGWWPALQAALPGETWVREPQALTPQQRAQVEIAIVAHPPAGALQGLPRLRLIQSLWAGVDRLLDDPSVPTGVPIARMVDPAMTQAMVQTALWAVLSLHRDAPIYAHQQRERIWQTHPQRLASEVHVAVLGLGVLGRACAQALVQQGYRVSGWRARHGMAAGPGVATHEGSQGLWDALAGADIVINLLPLTSSTRGLFCADTFGAMKPGAALVNLARGAHVVESDLLEALDRGQLGHAMLDVCRQEPLPRDDPLWGHPRITLWPHVAAQTHPRSAARLAADNVNALREGRVLQHLVDRGRGY